MKTLTAFTTLIALFVSVSFCLGNQISEDQQPFVKKYEKQKNIVSPETALINTDKEPALSAGFVSLYDGKSLAGWTPKGGDCKFTANGEVITGTCVPGSPSTYLLTDKKYSDFIFTVEMKWEVDGNSGVMFRADTKPAQADKKFETVFGPQVEMEGFEGHDGKRKWSGGIYGQGYAAWIYPLWLDAHQEARAALKKDEWNRLTIHAVGDTVKTWVNGVPAAHWEDDQFLSGSLGLQVHSGSKGTIHFRNIKVKELADAPN
jgi:hypothetical protein